MGYRVVFATNGREKRQMQGSLQSRSDYAGPQVTDFGALEDLTASVHPMLHGSRTGVVMAGLSGPVPPGGGGGGGGVQNTPPAEGEGGEANGPGVSTDLPGADTPGSGTSPGGSGGPSGDLTDIETLGNGGSGGGEGAGETGGGGDGDLPFTGLAAGAVAAVGGGLAAAGAALRRGVGRGPKA